MITRQDYPGLPNAITHRATSTYSFALNIARRLVSLAPSAWPI